MKIKKIILATMFLFSIFFVTACGPGADDTITYSVGAYFEKLENQETTVIDTRKVDDPIYMPQMDGNGNMTMNLIGWDTKNYATLQWADGYTTEISGNYDIGDTVTADRDPEVVITVVTYYRDTG